MQLEMQMVPRARKSDPVTSHEAAESQRETAESKRETIYRLMKRANCAMTHDEIIAYVRANGMHWGPSTIRSRVAELVDMQRVFEWGTRRVPGQRSMMLWRAA